jgi:DNA-directed RNA polymerase subunit M/transcription elongation factor TFIIS
MTRRRRFCPNGHDTFEVGRDSSYRCKRCKYEAKAVTRKRATDARRREAEAIAAERAAVVAAEEKAAREQEARREREAQRRREAEYRQALEAGGDTAAEARWERLSDELLDSEGRYDLCQWPLENGRYGACTRRTAGVYCWVHNRQLDRESERRRRAKAAEAER